MTQLNRRQLLKSSLAATAAGAVPSIAATNHATKPADIPVVDTHHHLWDLKKFTLPWLDGAPEVLKRSFVMQDYLQAVRDSNVVKTVYMEVNVTESDQTKEAEHVFELCARDDNPMVAAVIGGSPQHESFADYIKPLAKSKYLRGVRTVLHDPDRPQGMCLTPTFVNHMRLLGELGLSYDLCMRPGEISDGVKLARLCPDTRFIIDHCGNMNVQSQDKALRKRWMDGIRAAAQQDNMVCKISGIVVTAKPDVWQPADLAPNMNFCMDAFGEDRIFFGGDWPVCTITSKFGQWVDALKDITKSRSETFRQKLFHKNAERLYRLT